MAWAGKSSGGIVLILCRADRVHSQGMPQPPKGSSASDQLIPGWEPTLGAEVIDQLKGSSHLTISNPTFEDVDHQYISGYITELGMIYKNPVHLLGIVFLTSECLVCFVTPSKASWGTTC